MRELTLIYLYFSAMEDFGDFDRIVGQMIPGNFDPLQHSISI